MGFRVPKREAEITFDAASEYHGAEITCRLDVPLETLLSMHDINREAILQFGDDVLMAWNIEDDAGNPIPADGAGLLAQPDRFVGAIINAWREAATEVPAPLSRRSSNGTGSGARSARMAG